MTASRNRFWRFLLWGLMLLVAVLAIVIILKREWVYDWWRGINYRPTEKMSQIRDELKLTDKGKFLFGAVQPNLSGRAEFNSICRADGGESETAVLGCYTNGNVYVYDIENEELGGIRELTTAHELLHAVWARMSDGERLEYTELLKHVFEGNREVLEDEINNYDAMAREEELYVRAGTEVKNLPEKLEKHFGEYFSDQDLVVGFYERYIGVFRRLEKEMAALKERMAEVMAQFSEKSAEYERRLAQLNSDIESFNACARTAGCFGSQWAFNARRGELVGEQEELERLYEVIDSLVNQYNEMVEEYNADVTHTEKLNGIINSNVEMEDFEEGDSE